MEYTQWGGIKTDNPKKFMPVLILVVMEYTQWVMEKKQVIEALGLNPCCNGIYSMSVWYEQVKKWINDGLNPCCNGIYSMSTGKTVYLKWKH